MNPLWPVLRRSLLPLALGLTSAACNCGPVADPCADAGVSTRSETTTTSQATFTGTTSATSTGQFVVTGSGGQLLSGPLPTSSVGKYEVTLPLFCGTQTVEFSWPGPVCVKKERVTVERTQCTQPDLQVTLTWDEVGRDFELHLIKPGGRINDDATDCTWTSCIDTAPDWGVAGDATDDPRKDVDNTGAFGPENIFLSKPENGIYWVLVEHWGAGQATADGKVTITLKGSASVELPITDLPSRFTRSVARIDWPNRAVLPAALVTDCTATWNQGCRVAIP